MYTRRKKKENRWPKKDFFIFRKEENSNRYESRGNEYYPRIKLIDDQTFGEP